MMMPTKEVIDITGLSLVFRGQFGVTEAAIGAAHLIAGAALGEHDSLVDACRETLGSWDEWLL